MFDRLPHAVTFDCWATLIYERDRRGSHFRRARAVAAALARAGHRVEPDAVSKALVRAFRRHHELWRQHIASGAPEMLDWALADLGVRDGRADLVGALLASIEGYVLEAEIETLPGARETLEALRQRDVRVGLICDTGYSPGRLLRRVLDRVGLGECLDVQIYSDEAGVPKPDLRVFERALEALDADASQAVHVGDLKRTDVAGARNAGMASVRIRAHNDDADDRPDADVVVDSHADLRRLFKLG